MAMDKKQKTNRQQGFTLLEILVVVAIMGFLVAMVAPRFAGIVGDTTQTVGDASKTRYAQMVSTFFEQNNRYPSGLVNLVMTEDDGGDISNYQIPYVDNQDPADGREVLRWNHHNGWKHVIHILNEDEAAELRSLGITRIYNLNHYGDVWENLPSGWTSGETLGRQADHIAGSHEADHPGRTGNWAAVSVVDPDDMRPALERVTPQAGVGVAMSMVGFDGDEWRYVSRATPPHGRNNYFGRIVFGLGPESELVTSGMAASSGVTPVATTTDNYTWDGYYLTLPRLEATSERLKDDAATIFVAANNLAGGGVARAPGTNLTDPDDSHFGEVVVFGYERGGHQGLGNPDFNENNPAGLIMRGVNILDSMEPWDFHINHGQHDLRWSMDFSIDPAVLD